LARDASQADASPDAPRCFTMPSRAAFIRVPKGVVVEKPIVAALVGR
jgi:hypothetical protein